MKGGISSKYALSLHEGVNQMFRYEDNVSQKQTEMHYDYNLWFIDLTYLLNFI